MSSFILRFALEKHPDEDGEYFDQLVYKADYASKDGKEGATESTQETEADQDDHPCNIDVQ